MSQANKLFQRTRTSLAAKEPRYLQEKEEEG